MFRTDVNGLRFIAVIAVVLFHFKIPGFSGGFVGVDVFFVISGFLMNEACLRLKDGKNWAISFYLKRLNRIYPALLVSVIIALFIALPSAAPSELILIRNQVLAALTFTSNAYYQIFTNGYFSGAADSYLLLHTWSLAVEFQYYILFPLIFVLARKNKRPYLVYLLICVFSFVISLVKSPDDGMLFYFLPFRAWELLLGAVVSSLPKLELKWRRIQEILYLNLLILFFLFIPESAVWPNHWTIVPTILTALMIYLRVPNDKTILRFGLIQVVGLSSYSIYLIHWPLVYVFYARQIPFTILNKLGLVFGSLVLGLLIYKYVEKKVKSISFLLVGIAVLVCLFVIIVARFELSKYYLPERILNLDKYKDYSNSPKGLSQFGNEGRMCFLSTGTNDLKYYTREKCLEIDNSKQNLLLLGDSHAAEFYKSLKNQFPNYNVLQVTASGCSPLVDAGGKKRCVELMEMFYSDFLPKNKFKIAFLASNWMRYSEELTTQKLMETHAVLSKNVDNVYFIGQSRLFDAPLYKLAQNLDENVLVDYTLKSSFDLNSRLIKEFDGKLNYIDIFDVGCESGSCNFFQNSVPIVFDDNHFTLEWTERIVKDYFKPIIEDLK